MFVLASEGRLVELKPVCDLPDVVFGVLSGIKLRITLRLESTLIWLYFWDKICYARVHSVSCSRTRRNALAERRRKLTQVENLGQLATSFGQGLSALALT